MGNLLALAKSRSAEVKTMDIEVIKVVILAMVPMPKGDLFIKEVANEDGTVDKAYKPFQLIDPAEAIDYKFFAKNYMIKYQLQDDHGKAAGDIISDFVTENKIVNPMTVYSDVKATITLNGFTTKKGTADEGQGVGILSLACSTDNLEFMLKHNNGALFAR